MDIKTYKTLNKKRPKNKFLAKKTEYNGKTYDSKREATFAKHLEYLKHAHELSERVVRIEDQVPYSINIKNKHICTYFADFRVTYADGTQKVFDVKSPITAKLPVYRLKKKMVEAYYGIEILET